MNFNKFITKDGEVLLDLTNQTVSAETLAEGETAVDKTGKIITGLMKGGVVGGIKDVTELPTENIDTEAIYRLTESKNEPATLYLFYPDLGGAMPFGDILAMELPGEFIVTTTYTEVDELPDPMELTEVNETDLTAKIPVYILKTTGVGYISMYGGGSLRTMTAAEMLFGDPSFDKGYTDNIDSVTEPGFYAVHGASYSNYYYWKHINGNWNKVSPMLDVSELPTENIMDGICYRLTPIGEMNLYIMRNGSLMDYNALGEQMGVAITYIPIDALPETAPEGVSETTLYVIKDTGVPYMAGDGQFMELGAAMGGMTSYGWIDDPSTISADGVYMYKSSAEAEYYTYRNGDWAKFSTGGGSSFDSLIAGVDEETFVFPKGITAIAPYLCYGRNYTTVSIPSGVKSIGEYAFYNCKNLTTIEFKGSAAAWGNIEFGDNWISEDLDYTVVCSDGTIVMPDGIAYTPDSEGAAYAVRGLYNKNTTNVEILPAINDVPVVAIADSAFRGNTAITSITIPESITSIGYNAFSGCKGLTSIDIPESVTSIGEYAFNNCTGLTSIDIPKNITSISGYVFYGCTNLTSVTIPEGVTSIGGSAFNNCKCLTNIVIPEGVTSIGYDAFSYCSSLTNIVIPESVTSMEQSAFSYCKNLTYVTLPSTLTTISNYTFQYCNNLVSITLPSTLTSIGQQAFNGCSKLVEVKNLSSLNITVGSGSSFGYLGYYVKNIYNANSGVSKLVTSNDYIFFVDTDTIYLLRYIGTDTEITLPSDFNGSSYSLYDSVFADSNITSIVIPEGVTSIPSGAFHACYKLSNVVIPNTVTSIGFAAFRYCYSLLNITIPESLTTIDNAVFDYCYRLVEIQNLSSINVYGYNTKNKYTADSGESKLVTSGDYIFYVDDDEAYLVDYLGNESNLTLPNDINGVSYGIYDYAFYDHQNLTTIILPDTLTNIGCDVFSQCNSLKKNKYNDGIYLGSANNPYFALYDAAPEKDSFEIHSDTKCIMAKAFYYCNSITSIVIPEGVTNIGKEAFEYCTNMASITIPSSLISIGSNAFQQCYSLKQVYISDLAAWCGINFASNPLSVGAKLYLNGELVSGSLTIPEGTTKIGNSAFRNCTDITSVTIPEGVTSIDEYAFYNCTSLTSVTIPEGVISIGGCAFQDCTALTSIVIPEGVTNIGDYAFDSCTGLTSVTIPSTVTNFNSFAFQDCTSLTSVTIAKGITNIGHGLFDGCTSLTSIVIPEGVTTILSYAFSDCTNLTSVTIPSTLTGFGPYDDAFLNCTNIKQVYISDLAAWCNIDFKDTDNNPLVRANDLVNENLRAKLYLNGKVLSGNVIIPEGVTKIGSCAFYGQVNITSITLPSTLTSIDNSAFYGCYNLYEVQNLSGLDITIGSSDYGYVGYYAKNIYNANGSSKLATSGDYVFYVDEAETSLIGYAGTDTELVLPSDINGLSYKIHNKAFFSRTDITSVIIPEGVTSVGNQAFQSCTNLTNVIVPDTLTSIGNYAFYKCSSLTFNEFNNAYYLGNEDNLYVVLFKVSSTSITSYEINSGTKLIYSSAFSDCTALTSVTIPSTIASIGASAFNNCTALAQIHITDLAAWFGINFANNSANPLYNGGNLYMNGEVIDINNLVVPEGTTRIGSYAFYNMTTITSITLPSTLTSVGTDAFSGCTKLTKVNISSLADWCNIEFENYKANPTSNGAGLYINGELLSGGDLVIPEGTNRIGSFTFYNATGLTGIVIPEGVISIGNYAFNGCTGLTSINIPEGVTSIGNFAFNGCTNIETVNIPSTLVSIGKDAFYSREYEVYITDIAAWCNIDFATQQSNPLCYTTSSLYLNDVLVTDLVVPDGVEIIEDYAFKNYVKLTSVTLPNTLNSIGRDAFYNCYELTNITIPENVTTIGKSAFLDCYKLYEVQNLSNLDIVAGETSNGYVGYYAKNIYNSAGSSKLATSGDYMFYVDPEATSYLMQYTGADTDLVLPNDINGNSYGIVGCAFFNNTNITSITLPETLTCIEDKAFWQCANLSGNIVLPATVSKIGNYAFYNCGRLNSVIISEGTKEIGDQAFSECKNLVKLEVPNSITSFGKKVISGCSSLTAINIPECVTEFADKYEFSRCTALKSINIPKNIKSMYADQFKDCSSLEKVYITDLAAWCRIDFNGSYSTPMYYARKLYLNNELLTDMIIPDGITKLSECVFQNCTSITNVVIPEGVTTIESYAFSGCTSLTNITLPSTLTDLGGQSTFYGCTSLTDITIPNGVTKIGSFTFQNCSSLTRVIIPNSVTKIESSAFESCVKLSKVTMSERVTAIGSKAFKACTCLRNIILPEGMTGISSETFYQCGLRYITIPSTITSIGNNAFTYCGDLCEVQNLSKLNIIKGKNTFGYVAYYANNVYTATSGESKLVTSGDYIFYVDPSVEVCLLEYTGSEKDLTLPSNINGNAYSLDHVAFYSNRNITSVVIPEGVTGIGQEAFKECINLMRITIPSTVSFIRDWAFTGCYKLIEVQNLSSLAITAGSDGYGYTGKYAKNIYGADGSSKLVTSDDYVFYVDSETNENYLISYLGNDNHIALPATINDNTYAINNYAFAYCDYPTSVIIPGDISIGNYAFEYSKIASVIISEGEDISIGKYAFAYSKLTSVIMSEGVTSIGDYAFSNCDNLVDITIPSTITSIGQYVFGNSSSIENVYISDLTAWCNMAFADSGSNPLCQGGKLYLNNELITDLVIPENITTINKYTFTGCSSAINVTIPGTVTSIEAGAFYDNSGIVNVTISEGVTSISGSAFNNCTSLTSVTIPSSVSTVDGFQGCTSLTNVTISNGVTSIGADAFNSCTGLTSINIPGSVNTIGNSAFYDCTGLTDLTISEGVTTIEKLAFRGCTSLVNLVIPEGVTTIGETAFASCSKLASVVIPSTVTTFGTYIFQYCSGLTSADIAEGITKIPQGMFYGCTSLTSLDNINIPSTVTTIDGDAFIHCTGLTKATIPESVTSIGNGAFGYCSGLTSIIIPSNVTQIGQKVFANCSSLTSVTISEGVTNIGSYAFQYCSGLTGVVIPSTVTTLGTYIFQYCSGLNAVTIPEGITSIPEGMFYSCTGLTDFANISMPTVTSFGAYAFYGCSKLTSAIIPEGMTTIGQRTFYGCSSLASIVIPKTVTSVATYAFYNCSKLANVYYTGTSTEWSAITIATNNTPLTSATKTYEYVIPAA